MPTVNTSILFLILFAMTRTKVSGFNIEARNPIVKRSPQEKNIYFGFSVAQHAVQADSKNPNDYWILVGAPLGKNLQPNTNRSGALFKCPITNNTKDCEQIPTDGSRFDDFDYDDPTSNEGGSSLHSPGSDEIKEDQWLGVTVKSQKPGGKVVVCAHRYIQSPSILTSHYGRGLCYLLDNSLVAEDALQPCKDRAVEKLHQQFGFCQVGTSLAVLQDGYTLMGSPGPYTWRGTIFAKNVVGNFLDRDKTVYQGPLNDSPTPLDKYSYLGMSVTGGRFFNKSDTNYVSGAPRSGNTGQVFFFSKTLNVDTMTIVLIINGTQFGSSFGYEILAVDIDNDGYDELLVSAPFYYESTGNGVGGAVYLYKNLRKCGRSCNEPKPIFKGKRESRFGFSMASLGDINKDGYTDVAIGAPYEDDHGAVHIYLGTKNGLSAKPSQVITNSFKTIGYSLSGGLDMDLNGYPDLLVGAYESDIAFLYKTRPIIDINITVEGEELKNINVSKKGCAYNVSSTKTCFSFKTCFTLSKYHDRIELKYELKELTKKIPRVTFQKDQREIVKVTENSKCFEDVAYLVESNGDILTPIKMRANFTIDNDVYDSPILNKTSIKDFDATFQKNCGDDDVCHSKLILRAGTSLERTHGGYKLDVGKNSEFLLEVNVTNKEEAAYEAKVFIEHPEGLSYIALQTEKNKTSGAACTSNNESTIVTCNLGNPFQTLQKVHLRLRFEIVDTKQQTLNLNISVNSTSTELSSQTSQFMTLILEKIASFEIKGESKPQNVLYSGEVKGQSAMHHFEDIGPRIVHTYTVINQGDWSIRNVEVKIQWPYQVYTERSEGGKWLLYLENTPTIDGQANGCRVEPSDVVNPLGLSSSGVEEGGNGLGFTEPPGNVRRRRDVDEVIEAEKVPGPDQKGRKVVTMDCLKRTARCAIITCTIPQLGLENKQIKINITARLWNSTLIEDYSQVDWVSLKSTAEIQIIDRTIKASESSVSATIIETSAYPSVVLAETGVELWIIIVAVLAGLLLLVLVIFLLYKCGFFKRNRIKDRTLSANLTKQGENENLLKNSEAKPPKK